MYIYMLQALSKADNRFSCIVLSNQILYFANIAINPTQSPKWIFLRQPVEVLGESLEQLLCHYFVTIRHFITSFETSLISLSQIVYETWSEITEFDSWCKMNWIDMTAFCRPWRSWKRSNGKVLTPVDDEDSHQNVPPELPPEVPGPSTLNPNTL